MSLESYLDNEALYNCQDELKQAEAERDRANVLADEREVACDFLRHRAEQAEASNQAMRENLLRLRRIDIEHMVHGPACLNEDQAAEFVSSDYPALSPAAGITHAERMRRMEKALLSIAAGNIYGGAEEEKVRWACDALGITREEAVARRRPALASESSREETE